MVPCDGQGVGEFCRPLDALPKAHLHLHLPAAIRRSDFEAACARVLVGDRREVIAAEAESRAAEGGDKWLRRAKWLRAGCPYPQSLDSSDLARFDDAQASGAQFSAAASLAWDVQFAAKVLIEDREEPPGESAGPERSFVRQTLDNLVTDAAVEGVMHMEVTAGVVFDPADLEGSQAKTAEKWTEMFCARDKNALTEAGAGVSLMFVVAMPKRCKSGADFAALLSLLERVPGFSRAAIAGFGFFSGEKNIPAHAEAFKAAKDAGFRLVCIHAGEGEPSRGEGTRRVRDALDVGADRIGHGIEAAADAELMRELKERGVCLEVCPLSNRALGCSLARDSLLLASLPADEPKDGLAAHPLPRLLEAGVLCALSADDPLYWAAPGDPAHGLVREFRACRERMGLDDARLATMATVSFECSSAPAEVKRAGVEGVRRWLQAPGTV
eukprot:Hpha_TRINITY_DN33474_c0_g1::TRINITY_DN33474_c0_g1_i1::g.795::m.795/K01488/add, ADA; adenosine deaminase